MRYRIMQVGVGLSAGLLAVLLWVALRPPGPPPSPGPVETALIPGPYPPTPLRLETARGEPWSLSDEEGRMVALFFGYANCPDVCPLTLNRLGRIQESRRARGADGPPLEVVFVSVDPARDTPELLRSYVERLPGDIRAVSGPDVRAQAFDFGVRVAERPMPGTGARDTVGGGNRPASREDEAAPYLVDHTARTFLVDPAGRVTATIPPMASREEMEAVVDAVYRRWEEAES